VFSQELALAVEDGAGTAMAGIAAQEIAVILAGQEAQVLAVGACRGGQAELAGQLADLRLGYSPTGKRRGRVSPWVRMCKT